MTSGRNPDYIPGKTCENCGKPIPWRPGIEVRARARWCSKDCFQTAGRDAAPKPCENCGKPIPWREGRAARTKARFCCDACKFAWQKLHPPNPRQPRETKPCDTCGKPVEYLPSQKLASKYPNGNIYCSRECFGIGHSKTMTGRRPSGGIYTSPSTFRLMIRREFFDRCAICGWDTTPCDVAHIIDRKDGGPDSLENVVMLCPNHHRAFDMKLIPVETIRLARETILRNHQ